MTKTVSYQVELLSYLQDPQKAAAYLNAALEQQDPDLIALAFSNLAQAYGNPTSKLSQTTSFNSATLDFQGILQLLKDLGLGLTVTESPKAS